MRGGGGVRGARRQYVQGHAFGFLCLCLLHRRTCTGVAGSDEVRLHCEGVTRQRYRWQAAREMHETTQMIAVDVCLCAREVFT